MGFPALNPSYRKNATISFAGFAAGALFSRLGVGVDEIAGLVLRGREDRDRLRPAELLDFVPLDAVVLHPDRPCLGPFAVAAEGDVADDRVERVAVHIFGKLVVIESFAGFDGLRE